MVPLCAYVVLECGVRRWLGAGRQGADGESPPAAVWGGGSGRDAVRDADAAGVRRYRIGEIP